MKIRTMPAFGLAAFLLAGCGGGGGSTAPSIAGPAPTPSASPSPTPSPAPTPTPTPSPFTHVANPLPSAANAEVGLHQQTSFTVLSWSYGPDAPINANGTLATVGYDPTKTSTTLGIPGYPSGYLDVVSKTSEETRSVLVPGGSTDFFALIPGVDNPLMGLTHTSFIRWSTTSGIDLPAGVLAYGIPTPASGIPASGSVTYAALGPATFNWITEGFGERFFGATLTVNFATKTISGQFVEARTAGASASAPGAITLSPATISADGTFSGQVKRGSATGFYEGRLTGPQSEEIMLRWRIAIPLDNSGFHPETFGVLVGKR